MSLTSSLMVGNSGTLGANEKETRTIPRTQFYVPPSQHATDAATRNTFHQIHYKGKYLSQRGTTSSAEIYFDLKAMAKNMSRELSLNLNRFLIPWCKLSIQRHFFSVNRSEWQHCDKARSINMRARTHTNTHRHARTHTQTPARIHIPLRYADMDIKSLSTGW